MSKSVALLLVLVLLVALSTGIAVSASSAEAKENSWTTKTSMPQAIADVKAAVVNGKIYAMTGEANYEYDPTTDNWTAKTPMLTPRRSFGIAACEDKIYVIGGDSGYPHRSSTNEVYDPLTDIWETKKPMPTSRRFVEANTVNGKIYVIGGDNCSYRTSVNEVYDPVTDSWTTKQSVPIAVIKGASAVLDNKIYIIGGLGDNENLNAISNQIYDTEADTWSFGASLPTAMWYTAAGATAGVMAPKQIYVMGGGFTKITNVVNVYDPAFDNWTSGASLPTNRSCHAVAVVNDVLYAMGGYCDYHGPEPLTSPLTPGINWIPTDVIEQYTPFGYGTILQEPVPFPTVLVGVASVASVIVVGIGLLVCFKKRKR